MGSEELEISVRLNTWCFFFNFSMIFVLVYCATRCGSNVIVQSVLIVACLCTLSRHLQEHLQLALCRERAAYTLIILVLAALDA